MRCIDPLEPRRLLAGVTMLIHGNESNIHGWVTSAADAIAARAGGSAVATTAVLTVGRVSGNVAVTGYANDTSTADPLTSSQAEIIIKVDWSAIADGSTSTGAVANVVGAFLLESPGLPFLLASLPMHIIGHSRGASMGVAIAEVLGRRGVWVDHLTHLDAHPVDGVDDYLGANFGDTPMRTPANVLFADGYWRTDGNVNNLDFDGEPTPGAYNLSLNPSVQQAFFVSAHIAVTSWYHGTINSSASSNGEHPILSSWYSNTSDKPARTATGYNFARLGGLPQPGAGLISFLGGSGTRSAIGQSSTQWPSAGNVRASASSLAIGETLSVSALYDDRDSSAAVQFFVDTDRNPFNGNTAVLLPAKSVAGGALGYLDQSTTTVGLSAGNYYVGVSITDAGGRTRYSYRQSPITLTPPDASILPARKEGGVMIIDGTSGNDVIGITQRGSSFFVERNGFTQQVSRTGIGRIEVDPGAGNDILYSGAGLPGMYVFGGDGNDLIHGSDGNDTLTSGAGRNTLYGHGGNDRLNGSGGRDSILGGAGDDRIYGNGGDDTLDGQAGVDRIWGGAGNDLIFGGGGNDKLYGEAGNDTLYGQAGADLLDGGAGTDTSDNDNLDTRISIEVLL